MIKSLSEALDLYIIETDRSVERGQEFIREVWDSARKDEQDKLKRLLIDEISKANLKGEPTSALTRVYNKI